MATARDVANVIVGGVDVVSGGEHVALPDVGQRLEKSIAAVLAGTNP